MSRKKPMNKLRKMERVRKGYCKKDNNYVTLKAKYYIAEDNKEVFDRFETETYNHCVECDYLKKCKLYEEM